MNDVQTVNEERKVLNLQLPSTMDANVQRELLLALRGVADVLKTPLVLVDSAGGPLGNWIFPSDVQEEIAAEVWSPRVGEPGEPNGRQLSSIQQRDGKRRFFLRIAVGEHPYLIQSGDLPEHHAWVDGTLSQQVLPGLDYQTHLDAYFLLELYVSNICRAILLRRNEAKPRAFDDVDIENVRRIGLCLEKKIEGHTHRSRAESYSLRAVPSLEEFFGAGSSTTDHPDLSETLGLLTRGIDSSFNLMALTGDFVVEAKSFQRFCNVIARQKMGERCFANDIGSLIQATFLGKTIHGRPPVAIVDKCHAGLSEVFAPVYAFGLIVGVVFGGQLVESREQRDRILKPFANANYSKADASKLIRIAERGTIEKTQSVVSGISAMIGLLTERYAVARSEASLLGEVILTRQASLRDVLQNACDAIKRDLAVQDCSIFLAHQGALVLEATTAKQLCIRTKPGEQTRLILAKEAIGRSFYSIGEGLTGGAAASRAERFEINAMSAKGWAGKCSETIASAQCFVAPIMSEGQCRGVLRAVRLAEFPEMPKEHRDLIMAFARHLGVGMRYRELAEGDSITFKRRADELQDLLAEAAHELRAPLHNVLSLSTALRYTSAGSISAQARLHQEIKEEVYRAKREVDDYLLRGIEGREELKYNFQLGDLGELINECASRFMSVAAKRGLSIRVDSTVRNLPKIHFDSERMEQVFCNLIDNAVKYSFANQREGILIKAKDKPNTITVSVTDNGLGIPKAAQAAIFQGYQRAVEDQSVFKPGTGLGLKIAKKIVIRHQGDIVVESEPFLDDPKRLAKHEGFKTTLTVSLPKMLMQM
jgi:signal transduction histidine kinase/ligand-binding sensor protein